MIYILLPAYNEEEGLPKVLPAIRDVAQSLHDPLRVVVVDDGSRDRTSEVARTFAGVLDLKLFAFEHNRGVGEVFKTGFRFVVEDSREPETDICIVLDSDNTQDPRVMPEMVARIRGGDDIVVASRFEGHGKMIGCPRLRGFLSICVSYLMRVWVRLPQVKDYSTFYKAYRVSVLKRGFQMYGDDLLSGEGFAVSCGQLVKLGNVTRRISEVPLVLRYDLKGGRSGMRLMKTIRGYLRLMWQCAATRNFRPHK